MSVRFIVNLAVLLKISFSLAQNTVGTTFVTPDFSDGYTIININTSTHLINNCGEVVKEWNSSHLPGNAVYLLANGNLLRAGRIDTGSTITMGGAGGIIELFD